MNVTEIIRFPPALFFLIILIGAVAVNGYVILKGIEEKDETIEMREMMVDMLEPAVLINQNVAKPPVKISVTVYAIAPGMKMDYSGWYARITVYNPKGDVYEVKEGLIGENQKATFEIDISEGTPAGRYSVVPMVGETPYSLIPGDSGFFEVR